jgi:uncharacterized lipoprotein YmbA
MTLYRGHVEPLEVRELKEYLANIYGDYLEEAFSKALRSRKPLVTFVRLLSRRRKMDYYTLKVAVAYFEYRYRGTLRAMVFD